MEQASRRQISSIDFAFKVLQILLIGEASKRKGVSQSGSAKKTAGVDLTAAFKYFNNKLVTRKMPS